MTKRLRLLHRMPAFLKRRRRAISFIGALIVFATFVAKEGLWERWKEEGTALETARYIYSVREDANVVREEIRAVIESRPMAPGSKEDPDVVMADIESAFTEHSLGTRDIVMQADVIEQLLEKLPADQEETRELQQVKDGAARGQEEANNAYTRAWELANRLHGMSPDKKREAVNDYRDSEPFAALRAEQDVRPRADAVFNRVLKRAKLLQKDNETEARWAWWIAAVLYTIGWSLAAVGRFYEVSGAAE